MEDKLERENIINELATYICKECQRNEITIIELKEVSRHVYSFYVDNARLKK